MNDFVDFLSDNRRLALVFHLFGFALGLGGATITDIFFFKFFKKFSLTPSEYDTFKTLSRVIWAGIIIVILSGLALYLPGAERLNESAKFLTKITAVAVIFLNGILLNLYISPRLLQMKFGTRLSKIAFASGAVSFTSWYVAFILGAIRSIPVSAKLGIGIYAILLAGAIIGSQVMQYIYSQKSKQT